MSSEKSSPGYKPVDRQDRQMSAKFFFCSYCGVTVRHGGAARTGMREICRGNPVRDRATDRSGNGQVLGLRGYGSGYSTDPSAAGIKKVAKP